VLLLEQLGLKQQAQSLVEAALRLDRNQPAADQLRLCLSPWGSVLAAIALKRFKPARAKLKPELSGRGNASPDAHRLMARVCLEEGKDLAGRGQVPQALEVWQEGLQYARSEAEKNDIRAQVEEACVRRGEQLISQGQYEEAIRFLERAHGIFAGPNLKRTLSNAYTERGREKFSRDDLAGAQRDLEKALNLNEDNLRAKDLLATVYNNRSVEAFNRGELDTACDLIEKSLRMDPNNRTARQNAAQDFYARANRRFADLPQYARYGYRLDPIRADLERALEYADDQELRYAIARDLGIVRMH
jgi:tetratricopeptide (TPR) repeat protein